MFDQLIKGILLSLEVLLDFFLVLLHPTNQVFFLLGRLLPFLFLQQLRIIRLRVSEIFLINVFPELCGSFSRSDGNFSSVNILNAWKILGSPEVAVSSKPRDLSALCIEHLGILDSSVVITT